MTPDTPPPQQDPSWRGHIRATLKLGLPLIGSQLAFIGLSIVIPIIANGIRAFGIVLLAYLSDNEIADMLRHRRALGQGGVLVTVPPPQPIDQAVLDEAMDEAEAQADAAGVTGPARTPFVLGAIAELTDGASVAANTALVENNARVAAQIAVHLAAQPSS